MWHSTEYRNRKRKVCWWLRVHSVPANEEHYAWQLLGHKVSQITQLPLHFLDCTPGTVLCSRVVAVFHQSARQEEMKMLFAPRIHRSPLNLCFHLCLLLHFILVSPLWTLQTFLFFTSTANLLFAHFTVNETRWKKNWGGVKKEKRISEQTVVVECIGNRKIGKEENWQNSPLPLSPALTVTFLTQSLI